MIEKQDISFAALVSQKYDEALDVSGCVIQQVHRGRIVEQACLVDPDSDRKHSIQRQRLSHIIESTSEGCEITTPLIDRVGMIVNPQRLLVDKSGEVRLLSMREMLYLSEDGLTETRESLERSQPFPVRSIEAISDGNSIQTYEDSLVGLLSLNDRTLQERAQILLRSGFVSRRYCAVEWVDVDNNEFSDMPGRLAVVKARFVTEEVAVRGILSNVIKTDRKNLDEDSIEIGLEFDSERLISTGDGDISSDEYELTVEGNEVYVATSTPAGFSNLTPEGLVLLGEIIDSAILVPYKSK